MLSNCAVGRHTYAWADGFIKVTVARRRYCMSTVFWKDHRYILVSDITLGEEGQQTRQLGVLALRKLMGKLLAISKP